MLIVLLLGWIGFESRLWAQMTATDRSHALWCASGVSALENYRYPLQDMSGRRIELERQVEMRMPVIIPVTPFPEATGPREFLTYCNAGPGEVRVQRIQLAADAPATTRNLIPVDRCEPSRARRGRRGSIEAPLVVGFRVRAGQITFTPGVSAPGLISHSASTLPPGPDHDAALERLAGIASASFPSMADRLEQAEPEVRCLVRTLSETERRSCCSRAMPALGRLQRLLSVAEDCSRPNPAFSDSAAAGRLARAYHAVESTDLDADGRTTRTQLSLAFCSDLPASVGVAPTGGAQPSSVARMGAPPLGPGPGADDLRGASRSSAGDVNH